MDSGIVKYIIFALLGILICFNLFFGYKINSYCENKMELSQLHSYYKGVMFDKEKNERENDFLLFENGRAPKKKVDDANGNFINREESNQDRFSYTANQLYNDNEKLRLKDSGENLKLAFRESTEKNAQESVNILSPEQKQKDIFIIGKLRQNVTKFRGLKVDWWFDICMKRTIKEQVWHPLLPKMPQNVTRTYQLGDDERIVGSHFRRIYGYVYTKMSGYYDFKLLSRDGAELLLLDTNLRTNSYKTIPDINSLPEVLYMSLGKDTMDYQDKKIELSQMFSIEKSKVWLKANNLYFVELIQGGRFFAKYQIKWRTGNKDYVIIPESNLIYTNYMFSTTTPSRILAKHHTIQRYPVREAEAVRLAFFRTPVLKVKNRLHISSLLCPVEEPSKKFISYTYQGYIEYAENFLVYPKEHFAFINTDESHILLNRERALSIAHQTFDQINSLYQGKLRLQNLVHIVSNVNRSYMEPSEWKRRYFFVELDVAVKGQGTVYRTSHFIKLSPTGICFMEDHMVREDAEINIMTPIRNQLVWLKYLVQMLEEIMETTKEKNYKLILIDNNSTDGNYEDVLKKSKLKFLYLNLPIKNFNKVKALNHGLKYVKDEDSIAFVLDLHLQLPLNIFDRIRKLTIQGRTAFSPSLLKLECGEHEQYTELYSSAWLDIGTGMIALYKSDWSLIGGFNEKLFSNKWGGEDWEVIDRIFQNGLYLIHMRLPRFYHVHHSRHGMWDRKRQ